MHMGVTETGIAAGSFTEPMPRTARRGARRSSTIIVIPAHNEESNISNVIRDVRTHAPEHDRIVVNDGARDGTGRIVAELGERQLRLPCNLGYGRAVQAGLRYALEQGYDTVVTFDADGQHRAEDIPRLLRTLAERDADLVIGSRFASGRSYAGPLGRRILQRLFSGLTSLLIYDTTSGLKAMRARACRAIVDTVSQDFHTETIVALAVAGHTIVEEPITMNARTAGRSMYSLARAVTYPLQTLLVTLVAVIDGRLRRKQ